MLKPKESTPRYSADGVRLWMFTISEDYAKKIAEMKNGTRLIDESDGSVLKGGAPRCLLVNVKLDAFDLLNGTKTLLP
jgi:hypothetical protein